MLENAYADPYQIVREALAALVPPARETVAQYASLNRRLTNQGGGYVGRWHHEKAPYLVGPMETLTRLDYLTTVIVGPGQSGKALALDTPIATPSGWSTMGELGVGDRVFDEHGRICTVMFATETMVGHTCYRVSFSDGTSIVADADHVWAVETHARPRMPDGSRRHVWDAKKLVTTERMSRDAVNERADTTNRYAIRVAGALRLPEVDLPVDPYALGVWLGDGNSHSAQITLHENDRHIADEIERAGYPVEVVARTPTGVLTLQLRVPGWDLNFCPRGHDRRVKPDYPWGGCRECGQQDAKFRKYGVPRDEPRARDTFSARLQSLGVLKDKHIPRSYLRAGVTQRLALLQGLMDTDGTIGKTGSRAQFSNCSERLANDVLELVRSLGFKPTIRSRIARTFVNGVPYGSSTAYSIDFTAYAGTPVFRLPRKAARQLSRAGRRTTETERRRVTAVELVESVPVRCIQVDSESHLYLAGAAMVPTHNTEVGQNWLLKSVANDPGDFLWYMQTDPGLEAFVKSRINTQIDGHPEMAMRLGSRPIDDSLHFKRFDGMRVEFLSANENNLINKSAPRIVADEVDAYPEGLGDIKALLDVRRQTFGRQSMLLAMSHPDRARGLNPDRDWTSGVMALYGDSDRRVWYWPCPHCGAWSSPVPIAARFMTLHYEDGWSLDEIEEKARLICPVNGCLIEDKHRRAMNLAAYRSSFGGWVGDGQEISQDGVVSGELVPRKSAGFWIVGAMSPFVLGGIGGLARAKAKAEREFEVDGDDKTLKQVVVKQWGFLYAPKRGVGSIDANVLAERSEADLKLAFIPEGVRFLTGGCDANGGRFEWLVRGWGVDGESWVIDKGRINGDPATSPEDWDLLLEVIQRSYPLADGSGRRMPIRAFGFDSGGEAGVTQQAYAAWRRWRKLDGVVRLFGKIAGRDAWSVLPTKGASALTAQRLVVTYPDTARKSNRAAAGGTVPVAQFNPNSFKDDLAGQLQTADVGSWYVHFPYALRSPEEPHVWFEQLTSEIRAKNGRWEKAVKSRRNEALDLMVLTHMIAHLHGLAQIDWSKPPSFAASWDKNTTLIAGTSAPNASAPAPIVPPSPDAASPKNPKSAVHRFR